MNILPPVNYRSAAFWITAAYVALAAVRALTLSFTLDESMSFFFARSNSWKDIVTCATPFANNHVLNTLWLKLVGGSLGIYDELPLRLLNVAAAGAYAWFAWKLCERLARRQTVIALCGTLLFLLNPFVNDFFSLARGYGLALAFETAALYYLVVFSTEGEIRILTRALVAGSLAVLANFTFLYFYLCMLAGIVLVLLLRRQPGAGHWYRIAVVSLLLTAVIYEPVRKLKVAKALFYGGDKGFYLDSLQSFVRFSYSGAQDIGDNNTLWTLVALVFGLTVLGGIPGLVVWVRSRFQAEHVPYFLGLLFFLLIYAGTTLQYEWFKTPYLITRTTILLFPMMMLSWVSGLSLVSAWWKSNVPAFALTLLALIGFARGINFTYTVEWSAESQGRQAMQWFIDHEGHRSEDNKVSVGCVYTYGPTLTYYMFKNDVRWMHRIKEWPFEMPQPDTDYMVVHSNQVEDLKATYTPVENLPGPTYRSWSPLVVLKKINN